MINLTSENGNIFVEYEINGEIIGAASMETYTDDDDMDIRIERFDIADSHQRKGHGKRFISELIKALKAHYEANGLEAGTIFCAAEDNNSAAFWAAVGSETNEEPYCYTDVGHGVYVIR